MAATTFSPTAMPLPARTRQAAQARQRVAVPQAEAAVAQPGWLARLALWADAHPPMHHRMGSWTMRR